MDKFWAAIEAQCTELRTAKTADEVIAILDPPSSGDAFFAGGGGDTSVSECLDEAGWEMIWRNASYHWAMRAPDGSAITYVEGDVYKGLPDNQR
jgi:hypothetical protein